MTWRLVWTESARRDLAKLDKQVAVRVIRVATRFAETGHGDVKQLQPPLGGVRLRAGDWRLRFELDEAEGVMQVIRVLHRREAYRDR